MRFDLHDGLEVLCQGYLEVYAPRGTYQFVVRQIQPKGLGALELALRQLRDKLAAEGLFDPRRKRPLPPFPRRVAVVTSPTGAALRDFLEVLHRRWRGCDVLVIPTRVQGEGAGAEIAAAIARANRLKLPIDCLVVARGGGSLEDLWAFNEEAVVRAICASRIPVVSAVGHEIDVTLSDLAADVRALTPSEAAELVVPAADEVRQSVLRYRQRLLHALAATRLAGTFEAGRPGRAARLPPSAWTASTISPVDWTSWTCAARRGLAHRLKLARSRADAFAARLDSLSPLAVLGRGYSLTRRLSDGQLVRDAAELAIGRHAHHAIRPRRSNQPRRGDPGR